MSEKTYGTVYFDRINRSKTTEEIKNAYQEMIVDEKENEGVYTAEELVCNNLGYLLGYVDKSIRDRWYTLLPNVIHPVFGKKFGRDGDPTMEEAFNMGKQAGQKRGRS